MPEGDGQGGVTKVQNMPPQEGNEQGGQQETASSTSREGAVDAATGVIKEPQSTSQTAAAIQADPPENEAAPGGDEKGKGKGAVEGGPDNSDKKPGAEGVEGKGGPDNSDKKPRAAPGTVQGSAGPAAENKGTEQTVKVCISQKFVNGKPVQGPAEKPELTLDGGEPMEESAIIKELKKAAASAAAPASKDSKPASGESKPASSGGGKRRTRGGRKRSDKKKKRKKTKKKDKKKKKRKTSKK